MRILVALPLIALAGCVCAPQRLCPGGVPEACADLVEVTRALSTPKPGEPR